MEGGAGVDCGAAVVEVGSWVEEEGCEWFGSGLGGGRSRTLVHVGVFLFADELDGLGVGRLGIGFVVVEDGCYMRGIRVCGGR